MAYPFYYGRSDVWILLPQDTIKYVARLREFQNTIMIANEIFKQTSRYILRNECPRLYTADGYAWRIMWMKASYNAWVIISLKLRFIEIFQVVLRRNFNSGIKVGRKQILGLEI